MYAMTTYEVTPTTKRKPTTYRLTVNADILLVKLSKRYGLSKTGIIELAIRDLAERESIEVNEPSS